MRPYLLITALFFGWFTVMSQTNQPSAKNNAVMMRQMRLKMMNAPAELGLKPTQEYPRVCGVLMDWPIQMGTITVVSLSTGDASVYSTGTFGVLGGIGHEDIRDAARHLVKVGEKHYDDATPTKDFPYPKAGRVRFYLVCYDGVRVIDEDLDSVRSGKDTSSDLYNAAQQVITVIRITAQQQKGGTP
jgi:hypothetical protein